MISRSKAKFIKSLQLKKFRKLERAFVVEGAKSALELINADYRILMFLATPDFLKKHAQKLNPAAYEVLEASESELAAVGGFKTNRDALAVAEVKPQKPPAEATYLLALDDIRDPGNLGAILRVADWYGINDVVASETTAEFYNPKTLQASMGSFTRVNIFYTDLAVFLRDIDAPVYGADLEGENIHTTDFAEKGVILIGNEARGLNAGLEPFIFKKISIPRFGGAESLNAASAAAVICDNLRRSRRR